MDKLDQILESRETPYLSSKAAHEVSQWRRNKLSEQIEAGVFKESKTSIVKQNNSFHITSSVGSLKTAQVVSGGSTYGGYKGSGDTVKQSPEVYSPLWLNSNISIPRDKATINAWSRAFYALNPFVHNAINLHSTYPISKLNITCANKEIEDFFNQMIEEIDLLNVCIQIAQEYWLLGEAFPYAELDEIRGTWSRIFIQNPDYMIVKRTPVSSEPQILMRADDNIKKLINSNKPSDIKEQKKLPADFIHYIKKGNNIPLNNLNVSFLARRISPYEIRGTGLPVTIFRNLMLFDMLRESKFAQASNMINPLTLVTLGSPDYKPSPEAIEQVRQTMEMAQSDKDFKIFTTDALKIERIGAGSGIYDISGDITQLIKEIYVGLQVPPIVMDGGGDITYANGGVAIDVLRQRYMSFRGMLSKWLKQKIFAPICEIQGFYEFKNGKKKLIIPDVDWNHMSLFDSGDYINNLMQLTQGEPDARRLSLQSLYKSLGFDYKDETRKLRQEAIQSAIMKKEKAALESMNLNELRALEDGSEINEKLDGSSDAKVPGEESSSDSGGGDNTLPEAPPMPESPAPTT
jgi:hypothetical protein